MNVNSAHQSKWAIAEIVFGVPLLASIGVEFIFPLPFLPGILTKVSILVGITLIITSVSLIVISRREMNRFGQPTDPGHPTTRVVKTGIFSISRNPLYLSDVILLAGIALWMNTVWGFVGLLVATITCHFILITPEEKYLADKFGDNYREYTKTVHRWLGRKRSKR